MKLVFKLASMQITFPVGLHTQADLVKDRLGQAVQLSLALPGLSELGLVQRCSTARPEHEL